MAKLFNRAKMDTSTTGSGTITLGSAVDGYQSFADAGVVDSDVVQYVIEDGTSWEIGTGTYSATGTSLTRTPSESSNGGSAISLTGAAEVFITAVADDLNRLQNAGSDIVTVSSSGAAVTGNITVTGTVDGRDIASDGTKLDGLNSADYVGVTGDSMTGALSISQSTAGTASLSVTNSGGSGNNALIASFVGDSDAIEIRNDGAGDYKIVNNQQDNGITIKDGTGGVKLRYNGTDVAGCDNSGGFEVTSGDLSVTNNITVGGTVDGRDVAADGTKLDGIESGATADQTASEILTAVKTVDGAGSGLDADTVDGLNASSFLRSDTNNSYIQSEGRSTSWGVTSGTSTGALNAVMGTSSGATWLISGTSGGTFRGGWQVLDGGGSSRFYLGSNYYSLSGSTGSIWHSGNDGSGSGLDADTLDGQHGSYYQPAASELSWVDQATGNYGTIRVDDDRGVTWAGYGIRDDWVFMSNGAAEAGIYNDTDNEWGIKFFQNADTRLYHNGTERLRTNSSGIDVSSHVYIDGNIYHNGDTNTYIGFHAADQFRVVTGGTERFEINNSRTQIDTLLVTGTATFQGTVTGAGGASVARGTSGSGTVSTGIANALVYGIGVTSNGTARRYTGYTTDSSGNFTYSNYYGGELLAWIAVK